MGAALVAFRHPQCIRGMGGLLIYVGRGQWVNHGGVHTGELPTQLEAYRGENPMVGGGLKFVKFVQFWKIIARSRALAELYVLR